MKIRSDFVTNSSSSSFVLAFKPNEDIEQVIRKYYNGSESGYLVKSIKEHVHEPQYYDMCVNEELDYSAYYDFMFGRCEEYLDPDDTDLRFSDRYDMQEKDPERFREAVDRIRVEMRKRYDEKIKDADRISIIEVGDDTLEGSELEHEILPSLPCTVEVFSHH